MQGTYGLGKRPGKKELSLPGFLLFSKALFVFLIVQTTEVSAGTNGHLSRRQERRQRQ